MIGTAGYCGNPAFSPVPRFKARWHVQEDMDMASLAIAIFADPAIGGAPITAPTNIHGIDYDPQSDSLVISDVGSAASATDGKLYVIPAAGMANGLAEMSVMIAGPNSMLGNPVDLMLSNGHVYVAEKSNNVIMRFDNILNSASGDIAADYSMSYTAPESVVVVPVD